MFQEDYWERKALQDRREPTHPVVRHYVGSKLDQILPRLEVGKKDLLLDVGCGNGYFSNA